MKLFLAVVGLAAVALAAPKYEPIVTDYHNVIGIPEAARIKQAEAAMDFDGARITGGSASGLGAFPHTAGLVVTLTTGQTSMCTACLISETRVATAAHCWVTRQIQATMFTVVLGSVRLFYGGTRLNTNNIQLHNNFNIDTHENDVAIVVIPRVAFNNNIRSIPLASGNNQYVGVTATAVGFGRTGDTPSGAITFEQALHHVNVNVITNDECAVIYGRHFIFDSTMCVGTNGGGPCSGDSGGPLSINSNRELIGIASFASINGCQHRQPAGYARVTSFKAWFDARM